jgi:hypothetical protein
MQACNQNAIADGDMTEILQLPRCIEFIGQTYVMPGTLSRLWCIFEMVGVYRVLCMRVCV